MKIGAYILKVVSEKPLRRNGLIDKVASELKKPRAEVERVLKSMFGFKQVASKEGLIILGPNGQPAKPKDRPEPEEQTCEECGGPSGDADYCEPCGRAIFPEYFADPWDPDFDHMYDFREDR
jgi:hypothetical protein